MMNLALDLQHQAQVWQQEVDPCTPVPGTPEVNLTTELDPGATKYLLDPGLESAVGRFVPALACIDVQPQTRCAVPAPLSDIVQEACEGPTGDEPLGPHGFDDSFCPLEVTIGEQVQRHELGAHHWYAREVGDPSIVETADPVNPRKTGSTFGRPGGHHVYRSLEPGSAVSPPCCGALVGEKGTGSDVQNCTGHSLGPGLGSSRHSQHLGGDTDPAVVLTEIVDAPRAPTRRHELSHPHRAVLSCSEGAHLVQFIDSHPEKASRNGATTDRGRATRLALTPVLWGETRSGS